MASSTQLQDAGPFLSGSGSWQYDVFLSFRGADTRNGFIDHLYSALHERLIFTFKDDEKLDRGESISPALLKAIEESRFAVVVLSEGYASSKWCLKELDKILECQKKRALIVLPVFYQVEPSDLKNRTGRVREAFDKHEQDSSEEEVQRWNNALVEAANICGWNSETDGPEAELVRKIANRILNKLGDYDSRILEDVVGLYPRVAKVISLLEMKPVLDDPRVVGICGMGGIGKTTIAKAVYHQIRSQFHASCILVNVREHANKHGLEWLQKDLLSQILPISDCDPKIRNNSWLEMIMHRVRRMRVLVVLDDVDSPDQLDNLVGRLDWFGQGSRIIITTRNIQLLATYGSHVYNIEGLNDTEAFKLFCCKAFKNRQPMPGFEELITSAIYYAEGLPLALSLLGRFLINKKVDEWQSAIHRLRKEPDERIQKVLKLSYDGLGNQAKEIFLDIACFFKWYSMEYDIVVNTLNACGFQAIIGISDLKDGALITRRGNMIDMHNLIQQMGEQIVYEEFPKEHGRRSRLWKFEDIYRALTEKTEKKVVETIVLPSYETREIPLSADGFSEMSNLRLLKLGKIQLLGRLNYLSNDLRILDWYRYPLEYLPSNFQPNHLVTLKMPSSHLKQPWNGRMCLNKLKHVDFSYSLCITKTPDFTLVPNLKELILEGCKKLVKIDPSIEALKRLEILNLRDCKKLRSLPSGICGLKHLKSLIISGCSRLSRLPENLEGLERLQELHADFIAIMRPPSSIRHLKELRHLSFSGCKGLGTSTPLYLSRLIWGKHQGRMGFELPSLSGLSSLCSLNLRNCNFSEGFLPNDLGFLSCLRSLCLSHTNIISLPESIEHLKQLGCLELENCKELKTLPDLPTNISHFIVNGCTSLESLPESIKYLEQLEYLSLTSCEKLKMLPDLPTRIIVIVASGCISLETLPESIRYHERLRHLLLWNCKKLKTLPELPINISYMNVDGRTSLETLPFMIHRYLFRVFLIDCDTLAKKMPSLPLELLRRFLKEVLADRQICEPRFHAVVPGREIPQGFRYQNNKEHYIRIQPEANWYQSLGGFVVCAIVEQKAPLIEGRVTVELWVMRNDDVVGTPLLSLRNFPFQSNSIFLHYLDLREVIWEYEKENGWELEGIGLESWTEMIFNFNSSEAAMLVVEKCAVQMVYENDREWPNPRASIHQGEFDESQFDEEWRRPNASFGSRGRRAGIAMGGEHTYFIDMKIGNGTREQLNNP